MKPAVIGLVVLAAFWPAVHNGFVNWDDDVNILHNPYFRGLNWAHWKWMFTTSFDNHYQPLVWLSWACDHRLWGMDPAGYHLTNLLIHACTAVLFYCVAARLLRAGASGLGAADGPAVSASAAFAALLFALHPLRVECAAWASGRGDLLAGLFYVLAVLFYLKEWTFLAFLGFAASLLSKEIGFTLPAALLILDICPLRRLSGDWRDWLKHESRPILLEKLPFLLAALTAVIVRLLNPHDRGALAPAGAGDVIHRLAQASFNAMFYLRRTVLPVRLLPVYEIRPSLSASVWSAAAAAALTVVLLWWRRRFPAGLAAWAYYLLTIAPVLGFLRLSRGFAADRYTYLPCLSWAALGGAAVLWALRRSSPGGRRLLAVALGAALLGLGVLSWRQTKIWHDSRTLWDYTLSVNPNSPNAHADRGVLLSDEGRLSDAVGEFRQAIGFDPEFVQAHDGLGVALARQGELSGAIAEFEAAIRLNPEFPDAHNNLGFALANTGRRAQAIAEYREALRLKPDFAGAHNNLGAALTAEGDPAQAMAEFERALAIEPDLAEAHNNLGLAQARAGRLADAAREFERAIAAKPEFAEAHEDLGLALASQGDLAQAIPELERALTLDPHFPEWHDNLGLALAQAGRTARAAAEFESALKLKPDDAKASQSLRSLSGRPGRR